MEKKEFIIKNSVIISKEVNEKLKKLKNQMRQQGLHISKRELVEIYLREALDNVDKKSK